MSGRRCLACERTDEEVPLVHLVYRGEEIWICPGHMPVLIHDPARLSGHLADRLPGAEGLRPAEKHPPPAARRRDPR